MRIKWAKDETCLNEWNVKKGMGEDQPFLRECVCSVGHAKRKGERERGYKQLAGRGSVEAEEEGKKGGYGERFTLTKN